MKALLAAGTVVFILLLSACATGVAEFQLYGSAFDTQYVEATKVFDRLAAAERTVAKDLLKSKPGIADFDPNQAANYLPVGDPPLTGAIRASLDAVRHYNQALSGLATGEAAVALTNRLSTAATSLGGSASAIAGAAGLKLAVTPLLTSAIGTVLPIFELLSKISNRIEFRQQLVLAYPAIHCLLITLRKGTKDIFELMQRSYVTGGSLDTTKGIDGISNENLKKLEADRALLAGWVILLDRTIVAMDSAVLAIAEGESSADLAGLVDATVEIRAVAGTIRALQNN
jgi:hypothetical protein